MLQSLDLTTVAILATVALLEGIRRVPPCALIVRRSLLSEWRPSFDPEGARFRLLSWWSPLMTTVVLPLPSGPVRKKKKFDLKRLEAAEPWIFDLRLMGGVALAALVFGVPFATGLFGSFGFLVAVGSVLLFSIGTAAIACFALRAAGRPTRGALGWALPFVSPFAAPRTAEALLETLLRDLPPAVAVQHLLTPDAFLRWLRPHAYDRHHSRPAEIDGVLAGLDADLLTRALATREPPEPGATLQCGRCSNSFAHGTSCPDCGVALDPIRTTEERAIESHPN